MEKNLCVYPSKVCIEKLGHIKKDPFIYPLQYTAIPNILFMSQLYVHITIVFIYKKLTFIRQIVQTLSNPIRDLTWSAQI